MKKDSIWNGEDIYLAYGDKVLLIAQGTGDNLWPEDLENGNVDYFNLEIYQASNFDFSKVGELNSLGGGFMMRTSFISDEFYGRSVENVIAAVFDANGQEDAFNLCATKLPEEYEILSEEA